MKTKLVLILFAFSLTVQSQDVPIGQWKDYLSYHQGLSVCQGGDKIYCCTPSGVFSYNSSDNSIQKYNKVTGLSDIGCTVARYNPTTNTLVIGYSDGNIDLMTNNQVINIPDLKNSTAQGNKAINNVYFHDATAYVSCGQGIIVLDLNQGIILDLYYIGANGSALNVYSTTIFNDTIFASTEKGIYKISKNDPNPSDFQDWSVVSKPLPSGIYNGIVTCGSNMYASFAKHLMGSYYQQDTIYTCNPSGKWSKFYDGDNINSLQNSTINNTPYLVYAGAGNTNALDTSGNSKIRIYAYGPAGGYNYPNDALLDNNLNLWIADINDGLIQAPNNYTAQDYYPPGPFSNNAFAMATEGPYLYIAPGGYNQSAGPLGISRIGISVYAEGTWSRLIDNAVPDTLYDLCCIGIDPQNPLHLCVGSYSDGVIEYDSSTITHVYSGVPSTLQSYYGAGYYTVRVGGVGFDAAGNLWATNSNVISDFLSVKHTDGTWQAFNFGNMVPSNSGTTNGTSNILNLLITQTGAKWILVQGQGILAYQDNGTFAEPSSSNSVFITTATGNGALPSVNVLCMTEDLNGAIWVGTDTKVVVFYSPNNVFNGPGGWDAQNVYVQQTGYTQYLMQDQFTNCIAVDGANRKWIGTEGGGVFLMSADGTQQILNFTSSNSPLLSNNILSIAINPINGEVYFGTDKGVVSYRGDATEGNPNFSNVYAFPDPVPHGYSGPIAIKNLVTNSDVKIATVSGEVVYHTVALGGEAVWNGTNFSGERVQTGVYLVFCTSPDGTQSLVTKLLFVN